MHWHSDMHALTPECRDDKPSDEGTPWGEQEELEQEMLRRTGARAAVAAAAGGVGGAQEQFELVFEDQIDFVNLEAIAGDDLSSRCERPCMHAVCWTALFIVAVSHDLVERSSICSSLVNHVDVGGQEPAYGSSVLYCHACMD